MSQNDVTYKLCVCGRYYSLNNHLIFYFIVLSVLRRRMQEAEQKQAQLNRKSHCFQNLIDASRPNKMARVDSPSPSVSPAPVSIVTTTNSVGVVSMVTSTSATSSITVVTKRDTETGKPTVIIPTRSSRKSSK